MLEVKKTRFLKPSLLHVLYNNNKNLALGELCTTPIILENKYRVTKSICKIVFVFRNLIRGMWLVIMVVEVIYHKNSVIVKQCGRGQMYEFGWNGVRAGHRRPYLLTDPKGSGPIWHPGIPDHPQVFW